MPELIPELTNCKMCPRNCGINRYETTSFCNAPAQLKINLSQLHHGEEPVLSGTRGSGAIFFSHCNLRCVFCQNYQISALEWGNLVSDEECVRMMLQLQEKGAHNINLVSPTHYSLQLVKILQQARNEGLDIPVVWNSNAYERQGTLKRLEGLVDIYLPDLKYASGEAGKTYSNAENYPEIARRAIPEMHRQVGLLQCDDEGMAKKGLIIRLLVLPNQIAGVTDSLRWIYENLGNETWISLMAQYYPTWQAEKYHSLQRGILQREYDEVLQVVEDLGFENGFIQELSCSPEWTPEFIREE